MAKLWFFGDSFTDRYILSNNKEYTNYKGYTPTHFTEILSEKLNMPYRNLSESYGMDNYTIFQTVCDNINSIQIDDILIIGWSEPTRFRMVDSSTGKWRTLLPTGFLRINKGLPYVNGVENSIVEGVFKNREHQLYLQEIESWISLINHALKSNKIAHWSWFKDNKRETITQETNGKVLDFHYSENGHIELAEDLLLQLESGPIKNPYKNITQIL
jgi:hypothetical protein